MPRTVQKRRSWTALFVGEILGEHLAGAYDYVEAAPITSVPELKTR